MQAHQVQPSWVSMAITLGLVLIVMAAVRPLFQRKVEAASHKVDYADHAHGASR